MRRAFCDQRCRAEYVLEIVKRQQHFAVTQVANDRSPLEGDCPLPGNSHSRNGRRDIFLVPHRRQHHDVAAIREVVRKFRGYVKCDPGLARTSWAGQRD